MRAVMTCSPTFRGILLWAVGCSLAILTGCAGTSVPASTAGNGLLQPPRLALAFAYYQNGQYRVALEESNKVLEAQPEHPQTLGLQALIYARLNETALAQSSFARAEQGAMQDADIAHNHGLYLCQRQQYPQAFERFARAVQQPLYADKAKTLWVWGVCAQQGGDELAAQNLWNRSLALEPTAQAALALAQSYRQQQQLARATAVVSDINSTPAATPETLWLGLVWARQSADKAAIRRYASQLQKQFPTSTQWLAFQREADDE